EWVAVGGGAQEVETFAASGGRIVVGSLSNSISVDYGPTGNGTPTVLGNVALWDGVDWNDVGGGVNGSVYALAFAGTDILVGGDFSQAGAVSAANIARWDGNAWYPLGDGVDGAVRTIHVNGSNIWVGGDFSNASGSSARGVARWDGAEWNSAGSGLINITLLNSSPASVRAMTGTSNGLLIGGNFTRSGAHTAQNIALWTDYSLVGVSREHSAELPAPGRMHIGNYPNPVANTTTIRFELEGPANVSLEVFDSLGRRVANPIVSRRFPHGPHEVILDASTYAPGPYFYRLSTGNHTESRPFLLIR
ncbi:MAG: T9SS type A sorting domain-containing protein, partial [Rhodothermales bacterium]|nr:T9SS type A sorting domain-containing protein [Rhodothermales bacterium]